LWNFFFNFEFGTFFRRNLRVTDITFGKKHFSGAYHLGHILEREEAKENKTEAKENKTVAK